MRPVTPFMAIPIRRTPLPSGARAAWAQQDYPAGLTVKFIVGYPAGGGQDVVGRIVADRLGALWKVPTIVENIAGASANIGMDRVAKGPVDGTQVLIVPPNIATNQYMFARMPFNPDTDIVPLSRACRTCCACARTCRSIPWPS